MPHRKEQRKEREREMVSGGMLDVIFVLVEIEMTVNCLADPFGLQTYILSVLMILD